MNAPETPDPLQSSEPQPLHDPFQLDPGSFDLKGKRRPKWPIYLVLGIVLAAGIGVFAYRASRQHTLAKEHAAFLESFKAFEDEQVGAFWSCLLGGNIDARTLPSNLALGQRIEALFAADPTAYPDKVIDDCVPKLAPLKGGAERIGGPDDYTDALAVYAKTFPALDEGIRQWAERAKNRGGERALEKKILDAANAFHGGSATPEAVAYDRFLRCALPSLDRLKDTQALLEQLFNQCKKPEFIERVRSECGPLAGAPGGKVDGNFKSTLRKFGGEDRDLQAWEDCFRRGRKGAKQDDLEAFGKAWVAYVEAGNKVREVAAEALKSE